MDFHRNLKLIAYMSYNNIVKNYIMDHLENTENLIDDKIDNKMDNRTELLKKCDHYNRGCHLLFPCCNEFFACRFCHDDEKDSHKIKPELMHVSDRKAVNDIKCRYCLTVQPISTTCINTQCQATMGNYFCEICKLLDLDDKGQYHCNKCGICRLGGSNNTEHCDKCGICFTKREDDMCPFCKTNMKTKIDGDCPICCMDLFNSVNTITMIKCGHWMHSACLDEYVKHNYKCPLCSKSLGATDQQFNQLLDQAISTTPMPDEYKDKIVEILCNECNKKNNVNFHFYGHKCLDCSSYNTRLC